MVGAVHALIDHAAEAVGALVVAIPFGVVWLVDDDAATLTASASWGRGPQLAVRCALASAVSVNDGTQVHRLRDRWAPRQPAPSAEATTSSAT